MLVRTGYGATEERHAPPSARADVVLDAAAGVHNMQGQLTPFFVIFADGAFDLDAAPVGHGLQPIEQQIDEDLLDLMLIKDDFGQVLRQV